jgi:tripartite-type tricarboxylate transporter receptor subunit TctC
MKAMLLAAAVLSQSIVLSSAQQYPVGTVKLVVPYAAGGGSDLASRIFARSLSERLGGTVIVENKPGASSVIGSDLVAKAPADGHSLLFTGSTTHATNPILIPKLPYDPVNDFKVVAPLFKSVNILVVHRDVPAKNVAELIEYARQNPGKLNYASPGIGTAAHLGTELLNSMAGTDIVHVPYKGTSEAIPALITGRVHVLMDAAPTILPHIQSGAVRALGSTSVEKNPALPDLPPISQTLPGFDASLTLFIMVRSGTPDWIVQRLSKEITASSQDPQVREQLMKIGFTPYIATTEELNAMIAKDSEKWKAIITKACTPSCQQ